MYHWQSEGVSDIKNSYQCLDMAGLKDYNEAFVIATQKQLLNTRAKDARNYYTRQDPMSRWRNDPHETVVAVKLQQKAVAINGAIPSVSNKKKEHE